MKKGRNAAIELAVPGIADFIIKTIRPYAREGGYLWIINRLDTRDKHRLIVPLLNIHGVQGFRAVDREYNNVVQGTYSMSGREGVFLTYGQGGLEVENYGRPMAEMFFDEPGLIERESVIPTLVNMRQAVAETLDLLSAFITKAGWTRPEGANCGIVGIL